MIDQQAFAVVEAIADYLEVATELRKKLDAYDGYSPDWAFSHDIQRRADAQNRVAVALEEFVNEAIRKREVAQ